MKSTDQEVNLAKSSDQLVLQTVDKHIRGAILSNQHIQGFLIRILSDQGHFVSRNQAIKVNFLRQSEQSLDPGRKSFYRACPLNYDYNLLYLVNVIVRLSHSSHVDSNSRHHNCMLILNKLFLC